MHHNSPLGANKVESTKQTTEDSRGSEALDSKSDKVKLDKSNILMLGPTGSGWYTSQRFQIDQTQQIFKVTPGRCRFKRIDNKTVFTRFKFLLHSSIYL